MKNLVLTLITVASGAFFTHAQIIFDDFELYDLGDMFIQNPSVWSEWTGDPEAGGGIVVVDDIVKSGTKAGYIGPDSSQDALLLLGNITSGTYFLSFEMYIAFNSTGYLNIQGETETNPVTGYEGAGNGGSGIRNSGNLYFNQFAADPGTFVDDATGETATYPEDEWFLFEVFIDLDELRYVIIIDGNTVHQDPVPFQGDEALGAIALLSIDGSNNCWIDDVFFTEVFIDDIDDFAANNFKLYPNPVADVLNIESAIVIDKIEVFDMLGNKILERTPNAISAGVDMSALGSGMYLVNVTIDGFSRTFKILK